MLKPANLPDEVWNAYKFVLGMIDKQITAQNQRLLDGAREEILDILIRQISLKRVYTTGKRGTKQSTRGFLLSQQQKQYRRTLSAHGFLPFEIPYMGFHRKIKDKGKEYNPVGNFNLVVDVSGSTFGTKFNKSLYDNVALGMGVDPQEYAAEILRATFVATSLIIEEAQKAKHKFTLIVSPSDVVNKKGRHVCNPDAELVFINKDSKEFNVFSHGKATKPRAGNRLGGVSDYMYYRDSSDYTGALVKLLEMQYGVFNSKSGHSKGTNDDWEAITLLLKDVCQATCRLARGTTLVITDFGSPYLIRDEVENWKDIHRDSDIYFFNLVGKDDLFSIYRKLPGEDPGFEDDKGNKQHFRGMTEVSFSSPFFGIKIKSSKKWKEPSGEPKGLSSTATVVFRIKTGGSSSDKSLPAGIHNFSFEVPMDLPLDVTIPIDMDGCVFDNVKETGIVSVEPKSLEGFFGIYASPASSAQWFRDNFTNERGEQVITYLPVSVDNLSLLMLEALNAIKTKHQGVEIDLPTIKAKKL